MALCELDRGRGAHLTWLAPRPTESHADTKEPEQVLSKDGLTGQNGYTRYWDECTATPFLFNNKTREFISYDDAKSSAAKAVSFGSYLNLKRITRLCAQYSRATRTSKDSLECKAIIRTR